MSKYDDIINLPYKKSTRHKPMSVYARAAQFSPFAALNGYDEAVDETARITDEKITLPEDMVNDINKKLNIIRDFLYEKPLVTVNYFVPDTRKNGGKYVDFTGNVRTYDEYENALIFSDGTKICTDDIYIIKGEFFSDK